MCHQQTTTGCHGDTAVGKDLGHMACVEHHRTDSHHLGSRESVTWNDSAFLSICPSIHFQYLPHSLSVHHHLLIYASYTAFLHLIFPSLDSSPNSPSVTPHLKRVLCPAPQVTLQEAQLDHELQEQLLFPAQVRLVQERTPSAQLQLLQSTWC